MIRLQVRFSSRYLEVDPQKPRTPEGHGSATIRELRFLACIAPKPITDLVVNWAQVGISIPLRPIKLQQIILGSRIISVQIGHYLNILRRNSGNATYMYSGRCRRNFESDKGLQGKHAYLESGKGNTWTPDMEPTKKKKGALQAMTCYLG